MIEQQFQKGKKQKQIGSYLIGKIIGKGTFANVRQGIHIPTEQKVSIKILHKQMLIDARDKINISRQIRILRKVRHPNIAQLLQMMQTNTKIYLVMQYVQNGQLFNNIISNKKGRLDQKQCCIIFQQLINTVQYLHSIGIAHRDIKPQNILLDKDGNVKLIDFGLSNFYQKGQYLSTACGSPCYAAPQMLCEKKYCPKTADLWSCGIVLYAMFCGYLPFEDDNTKILYQKIRVGQYEQPNFLSSQAKDLLRHMLMINPIDRFSIQQIRKHKFCRNHYQSLIKGLYPSDKIKIQQDIIDQMKVMGIIAPKKDIQRHNNSKATAAYYLLLYKKLKNCSKSILSYYKELQLQSKPKRCNSLVLKKANSHQMLESFKTKRIFLKNSQQDTNNMEQIDFLQKLMAKNKNKVKKILSSIRVRKLII